MKIKGKTLKIGEGVTFEEAQIIYTYYQTNIKGKKLYRTHSPLFIRFGNGRRQVVLHESAKHISVRMCTDRLAYKKPYSDWILIRRYKEDESWVVSNQRIK